MKTSRKIFAMGVVLFVTSAFAASEGETDNSQNMPMMKHGGGMMMNRGMMESEKMNPRMMEQVKASEKTNTEMMRQMMASGKMNPEMMKQMIASGERNSEMMGQMMASCQHGNMPMMDHQGMQGMMQMRMQNMDKIEQRLVKIESLLAQLLEGQKAK